MGFAQGDALLKPVFQSSIEMRSEPDSTKSGTCRWLAVPLRKKCGTSA